MDRESIQERFGIIGSSAALRNVVDRARQVARTDITVLIQGESGVGKELIAEAVHALSDRRHEDIVVVNCGAIPEGLIESELFGAEKGAYTGAMEKRSGYFEEADGGTIFLDEIGEMPQAAQVRLLRVLESGAFSRVGSSTMRQTDVRILAATNKDLAREVEEGRFREDLYYRLSTVIVQVPPLRERAEDVLPIAESFLHRFGQKYNSPMKRLTDDARALLEDYRWPGNVRELRNVAEQAVVLLRDETVAADDLRGFLRGVSAGGEPTGKLMRLPRTEDKGAAGDGGGDRHQMLYAIWELRQEVHQMRDQLRTLMSNVPVAVPRAFAEQGDFGGPDGRDFVIMRGGGEGDDYGSLIEDVAYEIEEDDPPPRAARPTPAAPTSAAPPDRNGADRREAGGDGTDPGSPARRSPEALPEPTETTTAEDAGDDPLPTLEDAERELIRAALRRFDGNRRQTAQALGISERTLYRKLKDMDENL